jgi:hypothetical protein
MQAVQQISFSQSEGMKLRSGKELHYKPKQPTLSSFEAQPCKIKYLTQKQLTSSVSAVVGVNPGFDQATFAIKDPTDAAKRVSQEMSSFDIKAQIYPGRVLYPQNRGCPKGGEVIGAVFVPDSPLVLQQMETLRNKMKQETVSVITTPDKGIVTTGFVVKFERGDLSGIARLWQESAAEKYAVSGFHVSAAVYDVGGKIYVQAEANPTRITNLDTWKKDAEEIVKNISSSAVPVFRQIGYHYLRDSHKS